MSHSSESETLFDQIDQWMLAWEDKSLDAEGLASFRELLRTNKEGRAYYVRCRLLDASLHSMGALDDLSGESLANKTVAVGMKRSDSSSVALADSSGSRFRWLRYFAYIAASLLFILMAKRLAHHEFSISSIGTHLVASEARSVEPTSNGVALLTRLVEAEWGDGDRRYVEGQSLSPGTFSIASGFAQIEFFCGATVVLEGPAEMDLRSIGLARLHHGRLRAQVPPAARGFSIEADEMTIVDLGTEFGLDVSNGKADVQVFDGEIELKMEGSDASSQLLATGEARRILPGGKLVASTQTPNRFVDLGSLETRLVSQRGQAYERWLEWSRELSKDSRLIAFYAMRDEPSWQRKLQSHAMDSRGLPNKGMDGAIVGAARASGRWPEKHALEFKRAGDRVRVQIPGEYKSLTFACWVRIDSLDRKFNSLFLTDHYNRGEPHWQILETGQLYFSVMPSEIGSKDSRRDYKVLSEPFWKPSLSGQWIHLAVTFDGSTQSVSHFLNGRSIFDAQLPPSSQVDSVRIGGASIGNWSIPTNPNAEFAIRNLNGRLDEFVIFSEALDANEIADMYEVGRPD